MEASNFQKDLQISKHIKFMQRMLSVLPCEYGYADSSRMTILFFAISGLDVLGALHKVDHEKQHMINWIYAQQILPSDNDGDASRCGFRGASYVGGAFSTEGVPACLSVYEEGHIAMTYTALCSLLILGDDLSRINKSAIVKGLKAVQLENGSFMPGKSGGENDMRFVYCACCISHIIGNWSGVNVEKVIRYIRDSWSYDHGFGQGSGLESHGGSTFCAIASLVLMGKLNECFGEKEIDKIKRWCILRQKSGFQGRPNKSVDTCYSFWVGASLQLLGASDLIERESNREYLMGTQHAAVGGFSKWPDFHPDVLHTYFGLCGLSLMGQSDLLPVDASLSISKRAKEHLEKLHGSWR